MANLLESQGIFDEARLPTNAVLAVIAAAYELVPEHGDFVAKAEKLLRAYLVVLVLYRPLRKLLLRPGLTPILKGVKDKHRGIKDFLSST